MADINKLREDVWHWIETIEKNHEIMGGELKKLHQRYKELIEAEQQISRGSQGQRAE
mgnify:CR=1 FL=1